MGMLSPVIAQDFYGKATYESKTDLNVDVEGRNIPEADKKRIMERMQQDLEKTFVLDFNRIASLYREEEQLEQPVGGRGFRMAVFGSSGSDGIYYRDVKRRLYYNQVEMLGKIFLIRDSLVLPDWKPGEETRKIGGYTCYKATMVKEVKRAEFNRMGRRPPGNERKETGDPANNEPFEEKTEEITVTAWYTPDIPVNQGPGVYWGLPGLILEVNADRTTIRCTKIVMDPEGEDQIEVPKRGKEMSQSEFDVIIKEKMEEIEKMHRDGPGRREGSRVIRMRG